MKNASMRSDGPVEDRFVECYKKFPFSTVLVKNKNPIYFSFKRPSDVKNEPFCMYSFWRTYMHVSIRAHNVVRKLFDL